jgi:uncharacterized protein
LRLRGVCLRHAGLTRALLLTGSLLGCSSASAFDHSAFAQRSLERHILPGYERLATAAKDFAAKAATLCDAPSETALAQTREAARNALLAWGRIEHIRFGPITQEQGNDRILFYPDPRGIGRKQIDRLLTRHEASDLAPEKLKHASVAVQGFSAVDRALWGKGSDALAMPSAQPSFRCRYVKALAGNIAAIAADTLGAWSGDYKEAWLHPGPNRALLTPAETTQALLRAYVTELEVIRLQRLAPGLGDNGKSGGHTELLLPQSGLAVRFIAANIEGVRDLLTGGFLDPALAADEKEQSAMSIVGSVATDLGFALRSGQSAIAIAPDVFASAEARAALTPMTFSLKNAEVTGRSALGTLTGVSLGFNSLDGD